MMTMMMKSKTRNIICIVLAVVTVLSLAIPIFAQASSLVSDLPVEATVEPDSEDKVYGLQEIDWYNHQTNTEAFGGNMDKASKVGKKASAAASAYKGEYVGPYGEVIKVNPINNTTVTLQSIALPIGMTEYEVPSEIVVYRLIYHSTDILSNPEMLKDFSTVDVNGRTLGWDFSHQAVKKELVVGKETTEVDGKTITKDIRETVYVGPIVSVETHRFQVVNIEKSFSGEQSRAERVKLPSIMKTLNASAFENNPYIKEVYGAGIEEVSSKAFYNCKNLEVASFPLLRYVRDNAFYKCNRLQDLDFSSVLSIGKAAFFDCVRFTHVNFSTEIQQLEAQAFKQCTGITQIDIPEGISISKIPDECFYLCTSLKDIKLPADIITIGSRAFYNCSDLRVLDFRKTNLDTINAQAFWGCLNLSYVLLPETLVTFKTDAFNNCPELRYVYFSHEMTKTQLDAIKRSDLANCAVTEPDKVGPSLYNENAKADLEKKTVTIAQPTKFTFHDVVDVSTASCSAEGKVFVPDHKLTTAFNGYKTYTDSFTIEEPGTYTLTAFDILGNKSVYTVKFLDTLGDVDGDKEVTSSDARLALRAAVGLENYKKGSSQFYNADFDGDGEITAGDARCILRVAVGLDPFGNA